MLKTDSIDIVIRKQRDFFSSGTTQDINFRKQQLKNLRNLIDDNENEILEALHKDLKKTEFEGCLTAVIGAKIEIDYALKNINKWTKAKKVSVPIDQLPGKAFIQPQAKGVVLIISPWNYPFHLAIVPLVGAIAAGNCAIIKPSELTPNTLNVIAKIKNNN